MACWYPEIADALAGVKTPKQAVDAIAACEDSVIEKLGYKLNPPKKPEEWLSDEHSPWKELPPEPWELKAKARHKW